MQKNRPLRSIYNPLASVLVKGKTTPANLARMTVVEFFNTIGRVLPFAVV
jgi:hypothetical protein